MNKNIFGIYKPIGPSSHDIIDRLRKITGIRKIGHAGTLDPLASGVLVVAIGREGTKQLGTLMKMEKEYVAEIKLGETSTTDDEEGDKSVTSHSSIVTRKNIEKIIPNFVGQVEQTPPIYSAVKIKGKAAYKYAREGKQIEIKSRIVEIKSIEILDYKWPILKLKIVCGSGVYIRSLARDIGEQLKIGAYMAGLERTRVGEFTIQNASTIDNFSKKYTS